MPLPLLKSSSRLLMFAPHPDDESLACGILLQNAVQAGASISVVYVTDGENNPWPQRCLSRRWRLNPADRHKWAKLRRQEALAALRVLGAASADVRFLGWPDQGLAGLLLSDRASSLARLRHLIVEWSPTDVVAPDVADRHRDHRALGVMLGLLFSGSGSDLHQIQRWSYIVHGRAPGFLRNARAVPQMRRQAETKRRAISCHQSQLMLSRRRFLSYAARSELLLDIPPQEVAQKDRARARVMKPPGEARMAVLHDGMVAWGVSGRRRIRSCWRIVNGVWQRLARVTRFIGICRHPAEVANSRSAETLSYASKPWQKQ